MYIANNKYIVLIQDVKTVVLDEVVFNEKKWDVVAVHYKDGSVTQMPYDSYEEARKGFMHAVEHLVGIFATEKLLEDEKK